MIRIDEIYIDTFAPWILQRHPGSRIFFCDPPGAASPAELFNIGADPADRDYVFFHDQEPVDVDVFELLFQDVVRRTADMSSQPRGHVVVSEQGESVDQLCKKYGWTAHYYFYHGWAALDWYRGYNRSTRLAAAADRQPTRTFMSPNRIIGGKRDHRVLFLYNVFKNRLEHNHISAPKTCPYEGVDISTVAAKYKHTYPDIESVFESAALPRTFTGEQTQLMHSYQLGNFAEAADSMIYVATETVYTGRRQHLTEKTFKAICLEMPFILVAPAYSLKYLRSYGFRTFAPLIDETYDTIEDPVARIEAVTQILLEIDARSAAAKKQLWQELLPIVQYNHDHFYSGAFEQILWQELTAMIETIHARDVNCAAGKR